MKLDLTKGIPVRGFLQHGSEYNREVSRTEDELIVERCNHDNMPYFNRYVKRTFLGLVDYWQFGGWWAKDWKAKRSR